MMPFAEMRDLLIAHFEKMTKDESHLFSVLLDKEVLYNMYLDSFPEGTNLIYRKRREHDCSCCRGFIRSVGNVVRIKDAKVETIWDFETGDSTYDTVFKKLSEYVKSCKVDDVFLSVEKKVGSHHNFEQIEAVGQKRWDHFFLELPDRFVIKNGRSKGDVLGAFRSTRDVFKNSLDKISLEAIDTVLDMIDEKTLYKGPEYEYGIKQIRQYKLKYEATDNKELFAWEYSVKAGDAVARIKNQAIGTLLIDITEGMDVETAVKRYENITAPANYKRPKPIFTQRMLADAQKKITELGYMEALPRRFAKLDDITVNDILYCNRDVANRVSGAEDIFGVLAKSATTKAKKFDKAEEMSVDDFLKDVLPTAKKVELYLENKHTANMVSLIAPQNANVKSMFKWGNNFSWAYSGNITDSDITQRVIEAGGRVDVPLRFSHSWNYEGMRNASLMDLHVFMPGSNQEHIFNNKGIEVHELYGTSKERVGWNHRTHINSGGRQDVDYVQPAPAGYIPVENTIFPDIRRLKEGVYEFRIHNWHLRQPTTGGFKAELAFNGEVYKFVHKAPLAHHEWVTLAKLELKNGVFKILEMAKCDNDSQSVWGLTTKQFVEVSTVCFSPNYWENNPVQTGHKHLFFMLKGCVNDETPSGMFNEFLVQELDAHRKVMEALGSKMRVSDDPDQLSGVGFALDKRNDVVVRVDGRVYKVKF